MRERADAATAKRDRLRASAERARGEFEASERQTLGMNVEQAAGDLTLPRNGRLRGTACASGEIQISR